MGHFLETMHYWQYVILLISEQFTPGAENKRIDQTSEHVHETNSNAPNSSTEWGGQWDGVFTLYLKEKEHRVSEILILLVYRRIIRHQVSLAPVTLEDCWSAG